MKKNLLSMPLFLVVFGLLSLSALAGDEQTGQAYQVQNGDTLYKLARRYFGTLRGVGKIVKATNAKAETDEQYHKIDINKQLEIGQLVWIPVPPDTAQDLAATKEPEAVKDQAVVEHSGQPQVAEVEGMAESSDDIRVDQVATQPDGAAAEVKNLLPVKSEQAIIVTVPKSNCEIRIWYNYQVVAIARLNERWKSMGMSLLERAKRAYTIRHNARVNGRFMMADRFEVATLRDRDNKKYGNPDGPTFEYLVNYHRESGFEGDEIYRRIIESSARTSPVFISECDK